VEEGSVGSGGEDLEGGVHGWEDSMRCGDAPRAIGGQFGKN
jgi:hypothetical protein